MQLTSFMDVFQLKGWDVHGNQFDLQIAAGGTGAFNNCAGKEGSMFPGGWEGRKRLECQDVGWSNKNICSNIYSCDLAHSDMV